MRNCCCRRDNDGCEGWLDNIFGNQNTEILLFLVVFLLLFTTYGRGNNGF